MLWALVSVRLEQGRVVGRCGSTKSEDGGSGSPRVPCDGVVLADGRMVGGCGEPCSFVTDRREK
jgi:hypothetical protein